MLDHDISIAGHSELNAALKLQIATARTAAQPLDGRSPIQ
jgi:hypothetical protein